MRIGSAVRIVLASAAFTAAPAAMASAHDGADGSAAHLAEDSVVHDAATESRIAAHTRIATATDARAAAAAAAGNENVVGSWGPVMDWPVVGVHVALLPNGKVLAYDSVGDHATETYAVHDHTRATVWDPISGTQTPVWVDTGYNVFCSGLAHLTDGSLFVAGGNLNAQLQGIVQTHVFNPVTNRWSLGPNMAAGRWYPTVTPLRNGEMLITEGGPDMPEVRTTAGGLRPLSTASLNLPLYPWIDVAPDGRAFYSGPDQTMRSLNTDGSGAWQTFGQRDSINRDYGSHALYDVGKILVAGGGGSSRDTRVIDINGATPQAAPTAPMAYGRRQHNLTVLADGSVLATGGNSSGAGLVDLNNGVYASERWDPRTGAWTTQAAESVTRQYHSTALLLPDGRVLSSGGGICGTCDSVGYLAKNAQVFTPPYLFKTDGSGELAPRPVIADSPAVAGYSATLQIATPQAAAIRKVALVRIGAVTHSVNMEQRYVPLSFTASADTLTATAPANANIAPPGVYMLFIVDAAGVPSEARMVTISNSGAPTVSLTRPAGGATFTAPATLDIAADAADPGGTVTKVEFFTGATKLGEDTTAPFAYTWTGVSAGTYTLTARATDNAGLSATSTATTIAVNAGNFAPTATIAAPSPGATFQWHPTITIAANATDSDGTISRVEFFDGSSLLGQDTSAPYSYRWKNTPSGAHALTAKAYDNRGAVGTSAAVNITVQRK
jgi:galactose oxidase-like protein/Big-like domain-containing protein